MSKINQLFQDYDLEHTLLVGFYGGGNYGDELLLEVMGNVFKRKELQDITLTYRTDGRYSTFHHDFNYPIVNIDQPKAFLKAFIKNKNIMIGGGGLWGLDVNFNIFLLSTFLFIGRWLLGKKVFLVGVGYYNSTNILGRISAFLAGKAANRILARDHETFENFSKLNKNTQLDSDISWLLKEIDLTDEYREDVKRLESTVNLNENMRTVVITLRRFKQNNKNNFNDVVRQFITSHPNREIILALMEPRSVDPEGHELLISWQKQHSNIRVIDFAFNPLAFYYFFMKSKDKLIYIGPQFHGIITAHLNGIPFFPVVYDNKVYELLNKIEPERNIVSIKEITVDHLTDFMQATEGGATS